GYPGEGRPHHPLPHPPPPPVTDVACAAVTQMYEVGLGREPEPAGLEYWKNVYYAQGADAAVVGIFASAEYYARHGSNSFGFVYGLYTELLQRAPDQAGFDGWVAALNAGQLNAVQVVEDFVTSPEYRSRPRW